MRSMTLSSRVCGFFLAGLAIVLSAVVLALTVVASRELHRRAFERLETGIATLVASAEIEPHELEWDRAERQIALGSEREPDEVRWLIRDRQGQIMDRSANLDPAEEHLLSQQRVDLLDERPAVATVGDWQLLHRRIRAERPESPPPDDPLDDGGFPELTFSAAVSLAPVRTDTRAVGTAAAGIALVLWIVAALVSRWYCRRALAPILWMAAEAERVAGRAPEELLRVPASDDELQVLGTAFNAVLNECRVAFDRQSAFASAAAHQLRTPLAAMLGEVEVALRRPRGADEIGAVLRATLANARDLQRTVESLLMLTRLRSSDAVPREVIDLRLWMEAYIAGVTTRDAAGRMELLTRVSGSVRVCANDVLLRQLLDNLVDNALGYSPAGSRVSIDLAADEARVRVSVADTGPGISATDLPHVFESFYRSAQARAEHPGGTGLGLAIARRIAEVHAGILTVASEPGRGTRFTFELPRCATA